VGQPGLHGCCSRVKVFAAEQDKTVWSVCGGELCNFIGSQLKMTTAKCKVEMLWSDPVACRSKLAPVCEVVSAVAAPCSRNTAARCQEEGDRHADGSAEPDAPHQATGWGRAGASSPLRCPPGPRARSRVPPSCPAPSESLGPASRTRMMCNP
jgi:hypothetical protein